MMTIGHKTWVIPGGRIPPHSAGREPSATSRDELCVLNTNEQGAQLEITVYYEDQPPVGPFRIYIEAQRMRVVRFNDLVDPVPILLDVPYSAVIQSDQPIVVQFTRIDTSAGAITTTMAYPDKTIS